MTSRAPSFGSAPVLHAVSPSRSGCEAELAGVGGRGRRLVLESFHRPNLDLDSAIAATLNDSSSTNRAN